MGCCLSKQDVNKDQMLMPVQKLENLISLEDLPLPSVDSLSDKGSWTFGDEKEKTL